MTYSPPTIPLNLAVADPQLQDVLTALRSNIILGLNCHAVGTVRKFGQGIANGSPNGLYVSTVTVDYSQTFFVRQPDNTYQAVQRPYPPLVDCPTVMLGGGAVSLELPVSSGDPCLILFNDRDLNNWFAGARSGPVASARAHSFADAIVIVGFARLATHSSTHGLLTNGNAEVGVPADPTDGHVRIANQVTTLYNALSDLINAIEAMTMTPGSFNVSGSPVTGTSGTLSSTAALEAVRTSLRGLLE